MTIQSINPKTFKPRELDEAVKILKSGGVIIYPTETCYALGGDFMSEKASKRIYKIKKRRSGMLLPVIAANLSMAKKGAHFSSKALDFAKRFWPGPVTLILPVSKSMRDKLNVPGHKHLEQYYDIALRVSSNKIAQVLSKRLGRPLISTSANISGKNECYRVEDVLEQLKAASEKPDLILDAGSLPEVKPSTIIKVTDKIEILRQGPVKLKYK